MSLEAKIKLKAKNDYLNSLPQQRIPAPLKSTISDSEAILKFYPSNDFTSNSNGLNIEPVQYVRHLSLKPHNIFASNFVPDKQRARSSAQRAAEQHLRFKKDKTDLSKKAKKNLFNALHWLEESASWKPITVAGSGETFYFKTNFLTLTIPANTGQILTREAAESLQKLAPNGSPREYLFCEQVNIRKNLVTRELFQECLNVFLTWARECCSLGNYVWKVEAQFNGQLHIHINTDQFLHYKKVRTRWNAILQKRGLLDGFFANVGHYDANSTDIHSIKNSHDAVGYVGKYMRKNPNFVTHYDGQIWGCSSGLKPKNKCSITMNEKEFTEFGRSILKNEIRWKDVTITEKSTGQSKKLGTIFLLKNKQWKNIISDKVQKAMIAHTSYIRSLTTKMPKEYYQVDLFSESTKHFYQAKKDEPPEIPPIEIFNPLQLEIEYPF